MHEQSDTPAPAEPGDATRRDAASKLSNAVMTAGLVAGYSAFEALALRFLYPSRPLAKAWLFVAQVEAVAPGGSLAFRTPGGERVNIARRGNSGTVADFIALSSTCPHLGCQVHWEAQNNRFFCPCHNGIFDPAGKATAGPPADAGQSLPRYPLKVEGGLLYLEAAVETLASSYEYDESAPRGPGHDPCLAQRRRQESC